MTLVEQSLVLEKCRQLFQSARGSVVQAMPLLHKIYKEKIYESQYNSFGEYVDECGIDRGFASRLITVFEHYVIANGVKIELLNSVNPERLYKARKLEGGVEKQLAAAQSLTSGELNAQLSVKENGEEHECAAICRICHRKMD